MSKKCNWSQSKEKDYYMTLCGGQFEFNNLGTPKDNLFFFCPFCGKEINEYSYLLQRSVDHG